MLLDPEEANSGLYQELGQAALDYQNNLMSKSESDPTGKDPHAPGAKLDSGKQLPALVLGGFMPALLGVVKIGTYGAQKYTPNGWKTVPNAEERYYEALMRHLTADMNGEHMDPETHFPHLCHAAWNILAIITLRIRNN